MSEYSPEIQQFLNNSKEQRGRITENTNKIKSMFEKGEGWKRADEGIQDLQKMYREQGVEEPDKIGPTDKVITATEIAESAERTRANLANAKEILSKKD